MFDIGRPELCPEPVGEGHRVGVGDHDQRHVEPVGEAAHADTELEAGVGDDQRGRARVGRDADGHVDLVQVLADAGSVEHHRLAGLRRRFRPDSPVKRDLRDRVVQPVPAGQQLSGRERWRGQQLSHRGRTLAAHDPKLQRFFYPLGLYGRLARKKPSKLALAKRAARSVPKRSTRLAERFA